jgi:hypothetical protein
MMRKAVFQRPWLLLIGIVLTCLPAGCSDPNERDADSGIAAMRGVADPKHAAGTPEQYIQAHKDAEKVNPIKEKVAAPKAKP